MKILLPLRTENGLNQRTHWAARARRAKAERGTTSLLLAGKPRPALPVQITLTRIAPRAMDSDGLAASQKHVRDGIADWLRVDDGDAGIDWQYRQRKGAPKEYAVEVEIKAA